MEGQMMSRTKEPVIREMGRATLDHLAKVRVGEEGESYLKALDKVIRSPVGRQVYSVTCHEEFGPLSREECLDMAEQRGLWEVIAIVRGHMQSCPRADGSDREGRVTTPTAP